MQTEISRYIQTAMDELGIKRYIEVANRAEMSPGALSNIINKGARPNPDTCLRLSAALLKDWTELFILAGYLTDDAKTDYRQHGKDLIDQLTDAQYTQVLQYIEMVLIADLD